MVASSCVPRDQTCIFSVGLRGTASNFGSAHRTNNYCTPGDLLRNLLWPSNTDSVAMRYGSINEKAALRLRVSSRSVLALWRFSEWLSEHAEHPELPIYLDEPGIWLSAEHPFLAGSPNHAAAVLLHRCDSDGVVYECLEARPVGESGGMYYRCRRSLLEIKTPWKLRTRVPGGDFYTGSMNTNPEPACIPCVTSETGG